MSNLKHTPGPWTAEEFNIYAGEYIAGTSDRFTTVETAHANARLIAAAPDLLEAARWLLGAVVELDPEPDDVSGELSVGLVAARAAISKAEGREHEIGCSLSDPHGSCRRRPCSCSQADDR